MYCGTGIYESAKPSQTLYARSFGVKNFREYIFPNAFLDSTVWIGCSCDDVSFEKCLHTLRRAHKQAKNAAVSRNL